MWGMRCGVGGVEGVWVWGMRCGVGGCGAYEVWCEGCEEWECMCI